MSTRSGISMFDEEEGRGAWIVTFADMMTLLLVFFILLYTLADFEDQVYRKLINSVLVFDGDGRQISVIDFATRNGRNTEPLQVVENMLGLRSGATPIENLKPAIVTDLERVVDRGNLSASVDLSFDGDQINLQIDGRYLFTSGQAELKDGARVIFTQLGQLFRQYSDYRIAIRGHTDDVDINTLQFPSNWELSAVRATTVLRFFLNEGIDPERMTATGYASFIPLVDNDSAKNRARNRRVEFVLEKEKDS